MPPSWGGALYGQTFRERVAVTFIVLAVVMGSILGIATVRSYTQPASTLQAATGGGEVQGATASTSGASASSGAGSSGGSAGVGAGASASQAASGVSKDRIVVGGIFDMTGPVDSSV